MQEDSLAQLVQCFEGYDLDSRERAVAALLAQPGRIAGFLRRLLEVPGNASDYDMLECSLEPLFAALTEQAGQSEPATLGLLDLFEIEESPPAFRARTVAALRNCRVGVPGVVERLIRLAAESPGEWEVIDAVRYSLDRIGPAALEPLIEIVSRETYEALDGPCTRSIAAWMLGDFSEPEYPAERVEGLAQAARASVGALRGALESRNSDVRASAAMALGKMGSAAQVALPELRRICGDVDRCVRDSAQFAVRRIAGRRFAE
jgi:HEAT repeat protein